MKMVIYHIYYASFRRDPDGTPTRKCDIQQSKIYISALNNRYGLSKNRWYHNAKCNSRFWLGLFKKCLGCAKNEVLDHKPKPSCVWCELSDSYPLGLSDLAACFFSLPRIRKQWVNLGWAPQVSYNCLFQ